MTSRLVLCACEQNLSMRYVRALKQTYTAMFNLKSDMDTSRGLRF